MSSDKNDYIKNTLIKQICDKFDNEKLVDFKIKHSGGFDGFMSVLYTIDINTYCQEKNENKLRQLFVKFMKDDESFRISSKSYIQFPNEIFIYAKVLPYYEQIVAKSKSLIKVKDWTPEIYEAKFEAFEGTNKNETILVMKNLNPLGYRCSPSFDLNRHHLLLCIKLLAEYHSMTYALRIKNDPILPNLIKEIIPLPFTYDMIGAKAELPQKNQKITNIEDNIKPLIDEESNFYKIVYRLAFDRFYNYFDQIQAEYELNKNDNSDISDIKKFFKDINILRDKYFDKPEHLLEYIRLAAPNDPNDVFSVILHGDYNRNNVLFKYDSKDINFDTPTDIKMIDFQELRYGTPAIDLSFLMYINMDASLRESDFWIDLLKYYHETVIKSLSSILSVDVEDESLKPYSFDHFYEHFSKYAFYGVLICLHFLPWKVSSPKELEILGTLFANDMHGKEFRKISLECGGNIPDKLNMDIVKHAHKMGYIKNLL